MIINSLTVTLIYFEYPLHNFIFHLHLVRSTFPNARGTERNAFVFSLFDCCDKQAHIRNENQEKNSKSGYKQKLIIF